MQEAIDKMVSDALDAFKAIAEERGIVIDELTLKAFEAGYRNAVADNIEKIFPA